MTVLQVAYFLHLLDRKLALLTADALRKPEDDSELADIECELIEFRDLVGQELQEALETVH